MMESFDLNSVSKRVPFAPLEEGYFERFSSETLARIERERRGRRVQLRVMISAAVAVAAMVTIVLTTLFAQTKSDRTLDIFDDNLDLYVESLSDSELSTLYSEIEVSDDFYANL